jgi:type I restriction enzyme S subunit
VTGQIDITPEERAIVLRILNEIVPDREVRAFGSRVTGKAKPFSDLDLAIMGDEPLPLKTRARLEEAFSESDLPWKVDVLDWSLTEKGFQKAIKESSLSLAKKHSALKKHASNYMNTQSQPLSPNKLQLVSLGELADNTTGSIAIGPFGSRMKANCYVSSGMPVIRGTNLVHGRKWTGDWVYVPLELAGTMPNCQVNAGDIVFPHRGAIGEVGIVPDDGNTYLISSSLMKIKLDRTKSEPDFIYYYFSSQAGREEILKFSSSVGTPGIGQPLTSMRQFKTPFFSLQVQKAIASILGSLDDKIDLNRRTNETLEAMARALFRDWFVDFGPTRAKMAGEAPYLSPELWELFPDRLDDEGKPEGWKTEPLDEIATFLNGLALQKYPATGDTSLPAIKIAQLRSENTETADPVSPDIPDDYIVEQNDLLFSWSGSLLCKFWNGQRGALNQHLFKVTSKRFEPWFIYEWIQFYMPEFQAIAAAKATTMGHIQRRHLTESLVTIPPANIMQAANKAIGSLIEQIQFNNGQSHTLAQLRDLLLPKLMSGEISIRDAEKMVEDVA